MTDLAKTKQQGQTWMITGASSGFGRLMAEYLHGVGATVIATARKADDLRDLTTRYAGILTVPLDVTSADSIAKAVADAVGYTGKIDVLVNNAGYGVCGAVEEVRASEYLPMFDTNFFGLVDMTKALLPQFREQRSGAIINFSSIGGLIGSAGWGFYNATKFAVEGLSEALFAEMAPFGVRVMVVEPGPFRTDFLGRSGVQAKVRIPEYENTVGKVREYFQTQSGHQPGDPQRAVEAVVEAISAPNPPKHLVLGKSAVERYRKHLQEAMESLDQWKDVSLGTDFPDAGRS